MNPWDELREKALAECEHLGAIDGAAVEIAARLKAKRAIETTISPGNGTRYPFIFLPFVACETWVGPRDHLESASIWTDRDSAVWVCALDPMGVHSAIYPARLIGRSNAMMPDYIAEHWFGREIDWDRPLHNDDVFILERLLAEIGKRT